MIRVMIHLSWPNTGRINAKQTAFNCNIGAIVHRLQPSIATDVGSRTMFSVFLTIIYNACYLCPAKGWLRLIFCKMEVGPCQFFEKFSQYITGVVIVPSKEIGKFILKEDRIFGVGDI